MSDFARPLPQPDHDTAPYFEACARHELTIQHCKQCGTVLHLPRPMCYNCQSMDLDWRPAGNTAKLRSWTVVTHPVHPAFPVPYAIALVELDQPAGVKMITNVLDIEPQDLRQGMALELTWEDQDEGVALPQFRPAAAR